MKVAGGASASLRWTWAWTDSETVRDTTRNLLRYKYLRARKNEFTGLVTVGVTAFCYPPRGQTLEPVKL